jgi:beta-glucosidase
MVLLKNKNGTLPLRRCQRILMAGPNPDSIRALHGGYNLSQHGDLATLFSSSPTLQEAVRAYNSQNHTAFVPGVLLSARLPSRAVFDDRLDAAIAIAKTADVVICVVAENSYAGRPVTSGIWGSLNAYSIWSGRWEANRPCFERRAPARDHKHRGLANVIVAIMLPGNSGAEALTSLLFGNSTFVGPPLQLPKAQHNLRTYIHKHRDLAYPPEGTHHSSTIRCGDSVMNLVTQHSTRVA